MKKIAIIIASHQGLAQPLPYTGNFPKQNYSTRAKDRKIPVTFHRLHPGLCRRQLYPLRRSRLHRRSRHLCPVAIAPCIHSKYTDPAVVNIDSTGKHVISVLSGHVGGANELTRRLASILGADPVITTQSDNNDLWALDTIHERFEGWIPEPVGPMNEIIYKFVDRWPRGPTPRHPR